MSLEIRTNAERLEVRNEEQRIISGRAVPYGVASDIGGYFEEFRSGAFEGSDPAKVMLYWRHKEPVGRVLRLREQEDGLYFDAQFSDTTAGRDAWILARDGVESGVSIAFYPDSDEWSPDRSRVVRSRVRLEHIATTDRPAHPDAGITETREQLKEEPPMSDHENTGQAMPETRADSRVDEVLERQAALEKAVNHLAETRTGGGSQSQFRSFGEYFKARVAGDSAAEIEFRALAENTIAENTGVDPQNWSTRVYGLINRNRPVISAFGVETLPASGMTDTWPIITAMPTVGIQAAENDPVASDKFTIEPVTKNIKTFAGGAGISRQAVDRSSPDYINQLALAMSAVYGKKTEQDFVAELISNATASDAFGGSTFGDIVEGIVNAMADIYEESEFAGNLVVVSRDVFTLWSSLVATDGRGLFNVDGTGINTLGRLNLQGLSASLANIPVLMSTNAAAGTVLVASTDAAKFKQASGAPFEITSDDPETLARGYAVYGYGLSAVYQPGAVRSVALPA